MISAFYCTKIFHRQSFQKRMNSFFKFWIKKTDSKIFLIFPIGYTLFLQILTGFPKPDSLNDIDANKLFIRFSEELFSYPFWLQDLSHLPLFFAFAWLWSWQLSPLSHFKNLFRNKASIISYSYAVLNELIQAFIPDRFPSPGDLIMNIFGVTLGLLVFNKVYQKIGP